MFVEGIEIATVEGMNEGYKRSDKIDVFLVQSVHTPRDPTRRDNMVLLDKDCPGTSVKDEEL
jgi:hypothetical protein